MSQSLSKNLVCVLTRSGVEIWLEADRAQTLKELIKRGVEYIEIEDAFISKGDFGGIYTAAQMEDRVRRKNGQWQCKAKAKWHDKGQKCTCEQEEWFEREARKTDELLKSRK